MTLQEATYNLLHKLRAIYPEGEAGQMTDWVMEHITGSTKTERMIYKNEPVTNEQEAQLKKITERLLRYEPLQYVLNEAWFCGLRFYVDSNVLIPRPETEELVEWIVAHYRLTVNELEIIDIGTGSGCIAISLKRNLKKAKVWACDVSTGALSVARKNSTSLDADINFLSLDFLNSASWETLPLFDIIVSNPPYVPEKDKEEMNTNVLRFEPHTALFVPDNDPLVFYRALAEFGKAHLKPGGNIYTEIHESLGLSTSHIFHEAGYETELKKDMQQKDRMLKACMANQRWAKW